VLGVDEGGEGGDGVGVGDVEGVPLKVLGLSGVASGWGISEGRVIESG